MRTARFAAARIARPTRLTCFRAFNRAVTYCLGHVHGACMAFMRALVRLSMKSRASPPWHCDCNSARPPWEATMRGAANRSLITSLRPPGNMIGSKNR